MAFCFPWPFLANNCFSPAIFLLSGPLAPGLTTRVCAAETPIGSGAAAQGFVATIDATPVLTEPRRHVATALGDGPRSVPPLGLTSGLQQWTINTWAMLGSPSWKARRGGRIGLAELSQLRIQCCKVMTWWTSSTCEPYNSRWPRRKTIKIGGRPMRRNGVANVAAPTAIL